ncbi:CPBP family intramembrane glutamic endopeptidase [Olsenella uli]|uniref:CPBP family intramembrane glutamic endopeptidase n=1 Tax=Olsenella uli TaxID=133926 RepID=UPI0028D2B31B|nr:CPBP family intramembrane glutamic endopeptidase [Olsenella uli]
MRGHRGGQVRAQARVGGPGGAGGTHMSTNVAKHLAVPAPGASPRRDAPRPVLKLVLSLALFALAFVATSFALAWAEGWGLDENLAYEWAGALCFGLACILAGGARLLCADRAGLGYAWHVIWPFIVASVVMMAMQLFSYAEAGEAVAEDWVWGVGYEALLCLGIGLFEELMCRGLLLNALLAVLGRRRWGVAVAAGVVSLVFGVLHISWASVDLADALQLAQAVLKVTQTALYSFALCVVVARTQSVVGVALLHGLDDFLIMFVPNGVFGEPDTTAYVSAGSDALPTIVFYAVVIAVYAPLAVRAARELARAPMPERGAFVG